MSRINREDIVSQKLPKMLEREDKEGSEYVSMRVLAPTLHYDGQLLIETNDTLETFRAMRPEVLLLGGSKSAAFQKFTLRALEKVIPQVRRVELPGLGHAGAWNTDRGGKPEVVAQELRRFFI